MTDLSKDEDLSIAVMNLISAEEHLFFSMQKMDNVMYIDMLKDIREMRKELLAKIVKNPKAEEWCLSKHLLAASMRLIEVGNKCDNEEEKRATFNKAYELYGMFWAINTKDDKDGK